MLNGAPEAEVSRTLEAEVWAKNAFGGFFLHRHNLWRKKNHRSSELIRTSLKKICKNFYRKILRFLQESLSIFKPPLIADF